MAKDKTEEPIEEEPIVATELEEPKEEVETPEEPEVEPEEPAKEEPEAEPEEEQPQMSRRKAERLEKLESLVEKLKGSEASTRPDVKGMDYSTALETSPEVVQQLEDDRQSIADSAFNQGLDRAKSIQFHTRLEIDAPRVEAKYPVLDKSSEEFSPALANNINQWYLNTVGYDPKTDSVSNTNVRYAEFVEGIMEVADQMAGEKNSESAKNIAKQAASTGLRPDGTAPKRLNLNKPPSQMTDEELKAVISSAGM